MSGFLLLINKAAKFPDPTLVAGRFAGRAHIAAMENQPVVCQGNLGLGDMLY